MKDQLKNAWNSLREFWNKLSKKSKTLFKIGAVFILLAAIAVTVFLNVSSGQYKILFPGITREESTEVYAMLKDMDVRGVLVQPQINAAGEVMVPKEQWDELMLDLAGRGYPKTAPAYNEFWDNTGFTTTEFEKQTALDFTIQDRIQETLSRIEGVDGIPVVTITVPEQNSYVWQESQEESTAGVLIGMRSGFSLSQERVTAIKNLVAFSVPKLKPENVMVVDRLTGETMQAAEEGQDLSGMDFKRLEYERQIEKALEENVRRLLSPRYGTGVTAVAKVTLNYDKTKLENRQLVPEEDGKGIETHYEDEYSVNGAAPPSGIVGETDNTDVPAYPNNVGTDDGSITNFRRSVDYDTGYNLIQTEKAMADVKTATLAVVVNDPEFTTEREDLLIDLISKGVNLDKNAIKVTNLDFAEEPGEPADTKPEKTPINRTTLLIGAGALLLVLLIILIVLLLFKHRHKRQAEVEEASESVIRDLQAEIEQHKRELVENAQANNSKDNAITNEIRGFAKENPEITASLIRSMLKEDE